MLNLPKQKKQEILAFKLSDVFVMLMTVKMLIMCWHFNIYKHDNFMLS